MNSSTLDRDVAEGFARADLEQEAFEPPVAVFKNGAVYLVRSGNLPIGDDQARKLRDHMADPQTRRNIGAIADRYVRDLTAALEASAAEQYHRKVENVHA